VVRATSSNRPLRHRRSAPPRPHHPAIKQPPAGSTAQPDPRVSGSLDRENCRRTIASSLELIDRPRSAHNATSRICRWARAQLSALRSCCIISPFRFLELYPKLP
jgi:hypothetical protein